MDDLIRRQDAERIVSGDGKYFGFVARSVLHEMWKDICSLPSAEPKTGKWIVDGHHIRCNQCGIYFCNTDREGDALPRNFCPNCGSRMECEEQ